MSGLILTDIIFNFCSNDLWLLLFNILFFLPVLDNWYYTENATAARPELAARQVQPGALWQIQGIWSYDTSSGLYRDLGRKPISWKHVSDQVGISGVWKILHEDTLLLKQMQVSHLRTLLPVHANTQKHRLTHANTFTHPLPPLSPCPMWAVASAAGPLTVVMVWNIAVTPVGLTSSLCRRVPCKAPCYPASCFPQVLTEDRGGGRETNTGRPPQIFSRAPLYLPAFAGFAATYCRTVTPGVIIVTHRIITCAQTQAE